MKEDKTEQHWDKLLHIRTSGRDDSHSDQYRYPYEPTPYTVLQRLADSGYIRKHNLLLDYGCGKGRVDFFLSWQTRCQSVGIEYDERIYENAQKNKETAVSSGRVSFEKVDATEFVVPDQADRMYFFNPFFYYPSDDYIACLMNVEELQFADEIDCKDLFPGENQRERIVIFELGEIAG